MFPNLSARYILTENNGDFLNAMFYFVETLKIRSKAIPILLEDTETTDDKTPVAEEKTGEKVEPTEVSTRFFFQLHQNFLLDFEGIFPLTHFFKLRI